MAVSGMKGTLLGEVLTLDGTGQPVTDAGTLGTARCLLVADCCARFLRQIEGHGPTDDEAVDAMVLLAMNVVRAAGGVGKQLTDDVRLLALQLGFEVHEHSRPLGGGLDKGRMDS